MPAFARCSLAANFAVAIICIVLVVGALIEADVKGEEILATVSAQAGV